MNQLENEIKQLIIDSLNLEGLSSEDIDSEAPLFGDGLGLDSIDALELGLAIKNHFKIKLSSSSDELKDHFKSVSSLAKLIENLQNSQEK